VLGIAGALGLILSFAVAILREAVDRVFRTARQVETSLNANCLAVLPLLVDPKLAKRNVLPTSRPLIPKEMADGMAPLSPTAPVGARSEPQIQNIGLANISQAVQSELSRYASKKDRLNPLEKVAGKRSIIASRPFMRQVVEEPLSSFAEAFRSIKVAADISGSHVIGITSTVPGEGKSTISSNLGELIAHTGKRIILIDGDLRNPSLTRGLAPTAKVGLLEILSGQVTLDDALYTDEDTGLRFLPSVLNSRLAYSNEVLASESFKNFVDGLRKNYEYVIIDFSPIAPVVDVRAATQIVDSYIYVIQWGQTQVNHVQHQLSGFPQLRDRLLGFVLNKANVRVLQRYETYYGRYSYDNYYGGEHTAKVSG
jgi:polysaccharide biosynthesis transport protein